MLKHPHPILFLALCIGLFGCSPTPSDIPSDASRHWSLKGNFFWTWSENLEHGCVAWMAKESWAEISILVDTQCEGRLEPNFFEGKKGLMYSSTNDFLLFMGYWPWTARTHYELMVFDEDGMEHEMLPCPYSLSQEQIDVIQVVANEALEVTTTAGEHRMLTRVEELLTNTNGAALFPTQWGCSDLPVDVSERASRKKVNPWVHL